MLINRNKVKRQKMQVILGSGGAISTDLAKNIYDYDKQIKLVSRNPKKVNNSDILLSGDITNKNVLINALSDANICYVTVGFEYNLKVWQNLWPKFIKDVVEVCETNGTKLVFFDNVYALGSTSLNNITEESPINPNSKKGLVRAEVDKHIIDRMEKGKLNAIIARSPDFYGEFIKTSMMMNIVYNNLKSNKKAQWLCNPDKIHSMGYTKELAYGTAVLGNSQEAYNQIWNLPVPQDKTTGKDWVEMFRNELGGPEGVMVLSPFFLKFLGIFMPVLRENQEMLYQFKEDYYFNSSKFINYFNYTPQSPLDSVKEVVKMLKNKQ